ncbi:hypothetical protein CSV77_15650 [Sporosarcina sp. P16b]|nr:hypothetical protein CSV77_15650 [Sporosarcina sp. P16b]
MTRRVSQILAKANSKNRHIGVEYCNGLHKLERQFRQLQPGKRRRMRKKYSKPIVKEFFEWIENSSFYGKNALATVADYTLRRKTEL